MMLNAINEAMKFALRMASPAKELRPALIEILDAEFIVERECVIFKYFRNIRNTPSAGGELDAIGKEIFINSFHTDDYFDEDHLKQGLKFLIELNKLWQAIKSNADLLAINAHSLNIVLAVTEYGVNIKTYTKRNGLRYLSGDLNEYEQPTMEVELEAIESVLSTFCK